MTRKKPARKLKSAIAEAVKDSNRQRATADKLMLEAKQSQDIANFLQKGGFKSLADFFEKQKR
jgi:hypothetical protein